MWTMYSGTLPATFDSEIARCVASPSSSAGRREGVVLRVGLAPGERLGDEDVDGDAVLGVHHHHRPGLVGGLHRPQDLSIVAVEHARIGHEQLEAGDTLVVDEVGHRFQRFLIDTTDDLVEAVVDGTVAVCLAVPLGETVLHALTGALHRHVDDRRDAAPRCCNRSCLERVGRGRATEGKLHVRVHVDATGDDVLAAGVDGAHRGDADRLGLPWSEQRGDRLPIDEDVALDPAGGTDDRAAGDESGTHVRSFRCQPCTNSS